MNTDNNQKTVPFTGTKSKPVRVPSLDGSGSEASASGRTALAGKQTALPVPGPAPGLLKPRLQTGIKISEVIPAFVVGANDAKKW